MVTTNPLEMVKLDDERSGWRRTGGVFLTYGTNTAARPASATSVCRFYSLPAAGLDSYFFSASPQECAEVAERFGAAWLLETENAFGAVLPDPQSGVCPGGHIPVHRLYNNRRDANHRYAVGALEVLLPPYLTTSGPWIPEGYGPDAVAMCAPT